jgi:hypothetical protein
VTGGRRPGDRKKFESIRINLRDLTLSQVYPRVSQGSRVFSLDPWDQVWNQVWNPIQVWHISDSLGIHVHPIYLYVYKYIHIHIYVHTHTHTPHLAHTHTHTGKMYIFTIVRTTTCYFSTIAKVKGWEKKKTERDPDLEVSDSGHRSFFPSLFSCLLKHTVRSCLRSGDLTWGQVTYYTNVAFVQ